MSFRIAAGPVAAHSVEIVIPGEEIGADDVAGVRFQASSSCSCTPMQMSPAVCANTLGSSGVSEW